MAELVGHAPSNGIASPVVVDGKTVLRTARWPPSLLEGRPAEARGTIVICNGRSEFIEKYYEVIEELRQRGLEVVSFDWRGQGLSDRALRNARKGHVFSFEEYERDLAAVIQQILEPFCPKPWFGLGHSMGGPILLHVAAKRPEVFRRLVLSAPMTEIAGLASPDLFRFIARWARRAGLGRAFIPAGRRRSLFASRFDGNVLTSDLARFERTAELLMTEPRLSLGPPTIGWIHAAFVSMAALSDEDFARRFRTPTLVVMPGADEVVDPRAVERFVAGLRASTLVAVPGSRHEILMERDEFRQQFWAAFDAFIPGSEAAGPRVDPVSTSVGRDECGAIGAKVSERAQTQKAAGPRSMRIEAGGGGLMPPRGRASPADG